MTAYQSSHTRNKNARCCYAPSAYRFSLTVKIALITETFPPEVNGVAMTLHRLVSGLQELGHAMTVVRPRQKNESVAEKPFSEILVKGFPIPRYADLQFGCLSGRRLRNAWVEQKPDLIHIATEGPLGYSALSVARKLGIPTISTFHTNFHSYGSHYGYGLLAKPLMAYFRWFHNRTGATFVPSVEVQTELQNAGFERVSILARGVDTQLFDPARRSEVLRASWGAGPDTPVVIYVGRVADEKNIPLTVKAFLRFRQLRPDAQLVIVGDGPERKKLEQAYPEIHFAGMQRGEALAAHYASGDFFFFGSVTETFGNVVTEALASGLVVLAYDYAAGKRHIRSGENGYTAKLGDEQNFLSKVETIAQNPKNSALLRAKARTSALEVSWRSVIGVFEKDLIRHARRDPKEMCA